MNNTPTIIQAMKTLFRPHFGDLSTWANWQTFLKSLFGLEMTEDEIDLFCKCTGRTTPPDKPFSEAWVPAGRRAGKSRIAALVGVFLACCRNYSEYLARGERGTVLILASDRQQAKVVFQYCRDFLTSDPMLKQLISVERADSIELKNMVDLRVTTSSFRAVRGVTAVAIVCDEIAFWKDSEGSTNPAAEVLRSLRPSMLTIPGALLLAISSTFAEEGVLFEACQKHFGVDNSDTLIWRAASTVMNPCLDRTAIDKAMELDPDSARCEYFAEFRPGQESYISESALRACVVPGRTQLPPNPLFKYLAFADLSGGMNDSATLSIGHREGLKLVLDCTFSWPSPHNPDLIVEQMSRVARQIYGVRRIYGDCYAGRFVPGAFEKHHVIYHPESRPKSEIYAEFVPLVMAGLVELLDSEDLMRELKGLVRRNYSGGRFSIDHQIGRYDDLANSVCGCLTKLAHPQQLAIFEQMRI